MNEFSGRVVQFARNIIPKPFAVPPDRLTSPREIQRIAVFAHLPSPTYDYYLAARLSAKGMPEASIYDPRASCSMPQADGTFVIICRYASLRVVRWIKKNAHKLSGVGFLIDDDLAAVILGSEANLTYRLKLLLNSSLPTILLRRYFDVVWASTPHLYEILGGSSKGVRLLPPAPPAALWANGFVTLSTRDDLTIAYHATAIHVYEHTFLVPIIREVLAIRPQVNFEVFVSAGHEKLWQGIGRVTLRKPVVWGDYVDEGRTRKIDIMLVPLTPSVVNESRASTKRIDVARFGAAAIFSASKAYGYPDESGEIMLPYDQEVWKTNLLALIDSAELRQKAAAATLAKVAVMTQSAAEGLQLSFPSTSEGR